jgi:hypothetical protein
MLNHTKGVLWNFKTQKGQTPEPLNEDEPQNTKKSITLCTLNSITPSNDNQKKKTKVLHT